MKQSDPEMKCGGRKSPLLLLHPLDGDFVDAIRLGARPNVTASLDPLQALRFFARKARVEYVGHKVVFVAMKFIV